MYIFSFLYGKTYAVNINFIHKKIDLLYVYKPKILVSINLKIQDILQNNKKSKKTKILIKIKKYIDFKLKNESYYNEEVSEKIKKETLNIDKTTFTDQAKLIKYNDLLKDINLSLIDKEFINIHILLAKVAILLNHQNFTEAIKMINNFFDIENFNNKAKFITKNIDYYSFPLLAQLNYNRKSEIIKYRNTFYPNEKKTAFNIVRKKGYKGIDCDKLVVKNIEVDLIDKKFCKIINGTFEKKDLTDIESLSNTLQHLSDRINYLSYIGNIEGYTKIIGDKQLKLGKIIIKYDKNFVNGYLAILRTYDNNGDCIIFNKYYKMLEENYVGDIQRKDFLFKKKYTYCKVN